MNSQITLKELMDDLGNTIVIPKIQRDYAQGRRTDNVDTIRTDFLDEIHNAVAPGGKPLTLDFIYGDSRDGIFTPLDGQQRLTTLYLLHWYAALRAGLEQADYAFLARFGYDTRYSAREFCRCLVDKYHPSLGIDSDIRLSMDITDQPWYELGWRYDPTISSMLVMLDAIGERFRDIDNLWIRLTVDMQIRFYFLSIKEMGLTDELYIKMNSRGKLLTEFEVFKARLERTLRIDGRDTVANEISAKMDGQWAKTLWPYRDRRTKLIDGAFLRYFRYICAIICYDEGGTLQDRLNYTDADRLDRYFTGPGEEVDGHINTLKLYLDCFNNIPCQQSIREFIEARIIAGTNACYHDLYRIRDVFGACLLSYSDNPKSDGGYTRQEFPKSRLVMLYAMLLYIQKKSYISTDDIDRRLRILSNLILNSTDEIVDNPNSDSKNRLPVILRQTRALIVDGTVPALIDVSTPDSTKSFSDYQITDELAKDKWLKEEGHEEYSKDLYALEDMPVLQGQVTFAIGLEHPEYFKRFTALFKLDFDYVDRALMSIGDYSQQPNKRVPLYRLGSGFAGRADIWRRLFHRSKTNEAGLANTKNILNQLLERIDELVDVPALQAIIDEFIRKCEDEHWYSWRYYYVKYPEFRKATLIRNEGTADSIYWWRDKENNPYNMLILRTRKSLSENAYQPFFLIAAKHGGNGWEDTWFGSYDRHVIKRGTVCISMETPHLYTVCEWDEETYTKGQPIYYRSISFNKDDGTDAVNRVEVLKDLMGKY